MKKVFKSDNTENSINKDTSRRGDVKTNDVYGINVQQDIVPYDNSKETFDFNFQREDKDRIILELGLHLTEQQTNTISYDYLKLKFPLIYANEAIFNVNSNLFFGNGTHHIPV